MREIENIDEFMFQVNSRLFIGVAIASVLALGTGIAYVIYVVVTGNYPAL